MIVLPLGTKAAVKRAESLKLAVAPTVTLVMLGVVLRPGVAGFTATCSAESPKSLAEMLLLSPGE